MVGESRDLNVIHDVGSLIKRGWAQCPPSGLFLEDLDAALLAIHGIRVERIRFVVHSHRLPFQVLERG